MVIEQNTLEDQPEHRVLVIEDSETIRHVCHSALSEVGLHCDVASTAEEGLAFLEKALEEKNPYDGLLLDWILPEMSGAELMQRLMNDSRFLELSIMVFSEEPDGETYNLVSQRQNNDIQHKSDLKLLPFRMQRFLNTFNMHYKEDSETQRIPTVTLDTVADEVTVMVVDDAETVREVYRDLLKSNGYEVVTAESKETGLEIARKFNPALAIIDYFMPDGNGDEMVMEMIEDPQLSHILPVMFSSSQREDIIQKSLAAGAIDVILKDDPSHVFLMRIAAMSRVLRAERKAKVEVAAKAVYARELELRLEATKYLESMNVRLENQNQELEKNRDLLEKQAAALTVSNRYKSEFLANMSHELRTPLNSMLILSKLMADNRAGNLTEDQIKYAEVINKAGKDLLHLINQILDLSKVEAGKLEFVFEATGLRHVFDMLENLFTPQAQERGLEFVVELDDDLPETIRTDRQRLEQIVKNFVSNAIKFTQKGSVSIRGAHATQPVSIGQRLYGPNELLSIHVVDTGVGISEDQQEFIFQPFKQGDGSTSRKFGGTGLGLSIAQELTTRLGGKLVLKSEKNVGTEFIVYLPIVGPELSNSSGAKEPTSAIKEKFESQSTDNPEGRSGLDGPQTLLLVDDDIRNLYALRAVLEERGFVVETASNGFEALDFLESHTPPNLVLMDIMMPEMDGYTAIKKIRENEDWTSIPIVAITANAMKGDRQRCLQAGADEYISKPVDINALNEVIKALGISFSN